MILYQLGCSNGHRFESWFRDSAAFDAQVVASVLSCPICGSGEVAKSIMAPAVVVGEAKRGAVPAERPAPAPPVGDGPLLDDRQRAVRAAMRAVRAKILAEGHDVGKRFPQEARLMHEGDAPMRPIRGEATYEEARGLVEDGIMILPIPTIPEELN